MTPPRGPARPPPCSASRLWRVGRRLPGQDGARLHGAGAERGLEGAGELLCCVWLPSGRREAPPERSGKLLTNVGPARCAETLGHGTLRRWPRLGAKCRPSAAQTLTGGGAPGWCSPPRRVSNQLPRPSSPLWCPAPRASVSPWGCTPQRGCQAGLSCPWGAGGTQGAAGRGGSLTHPAGSRPGTDPYLPPRGARPAPAVPAARSQASPCPARPPPPVPARRVPCVTPCPSPKTSSPRGHPGLRSEVWETDTIPLKRRTTR